MYIPHDIMPSKTKLRTELVAHDNYKLDLKKSSRHHHHHHGSKIPHDKALSPKASNNLKFKDKARTISPVRPPHADLPFEFVRDVGKGPYVSSTTTTHNQQRRPHVKNAAPTSRASKEEELVKYMSKVPSYLQSGGNAVQDNVLNFGVLDWKRLERWKQKQNGTYGRDGKRTGSSVAASSSSATTTPSGSRSNSSNKVDKPPEDGGKEINPPQRSNKQGPTCTQQEFGGDASGVKFPRVPEKGSYQKSNLGPRTSSDHPATDEVSSSSKEKSADSNYQRDQDRDAKGKNPERHSACQQQHSHCNKKDKVFLLLPKDFSTPSSSEISRRTSSFDDGGFSGLSWSSFSDVFSIEEVESDDSFLNIPHSCPLTCTSESESELDLQLDHLINSQGVDLESDLPCLSSELSKTSAAASNIQDAKNNKYVLPEAPKGSEKQEAAGSLNSGPVDSSSSRRFSFGIGRLGRSLSLREGAAPPHEMSSTYVSSMSGPVRTDVPAASDFSGTNTTIGNGRTKNSPFKRLLDPWLKHRAAAKQFSRTQSILSCPDDLDDFNIRPGSALESLFRDKSTAPTAKALLQVTFKGGLPLFKFLAETDHEILASTVKKLSTLEKDDPNWLYTFYSVHKVRRKRSGWKNQVGKHKSTEFSYTVVGQMKVSNAHVPVEQGDVTKHKVMESALYGVDLNKTEEPTSEFTANRELAAVVVKLPGENLSTKADTQSENLSSEFSDSADENERLGSVVVILPSGFHALPTEGVPSSLINRWRSGGLCDCGGWDVGCRLRILTNVDPDDKTRGASRASYLHDRCDLFVQGASKQTRPIFSLVSHGNGVFSVEYDAVISSLQAFSICVGFVNSQKVAGSLGQKLHNELGRNRERLRTPVDMCGDGPSKYVAYPPHSPVERV